PHRPARAHALRAVPLPAAVAVPAFLLLRIPELAVTAGQALAVDHVGIRVRAHASLTVPDGGRSAFATGPVPVLPIGAGACTVRRGLAPLAYKQLELLVPC